MGRAIKWRRLQKKWSPVPAYCTTKGTPRSRKSRGKTAWKSWENHKIWEEFSNGGSCARCRICISLVQISTWKWAFSVSLGRSPGRNLTSGVMKLPSIMTWSFLTSSLVSSTLVKWLWEVNATAVFRSLNCLLMGNTYNRNQYKLSKWMHHAEDQF